MKAILLAGGKGTRLRPLTIHTPKPIVPIFNRPFLHYQIDLLKQVPEIDEVILSLDHAQRGLVADRERDLRNWPVANKGQAPHTLTFDDVQLDTGNIQPGQSGKASAAASTA
mgnify:CR=1 FL=1